MIPLLMFLMKPPLWLATPPTAQEAGAADETSMTSVRTSEGPISSSRPMSPLLTHLPLPVTQHPLSAQGELSSERDLARRGAPWALHPPDAFLSARADRPAKLTENHPLWAPPCTTRPSAEDAGPRASHTSRDEAGG